MTTIAPIIQSAASRSKRRAAPTVSRTERAGQEPAAAAVAAPVRETRTALSSASAPAVPPAPLRFYPAYCFAVSPTYHIWVKLTAADVHGVLKERDGFTGQNIYFYLNHPVRYVRLTGVLVACEEFERIWLMELDDGSGAVIDVIYRKPMPIPAAATGDAVPLGVAGANVTAPNGAGNAVLARERNHVGGGLQSAEAPKQENQQGTSPSPQGPDMAGIDLGAVVKVKGTVSRFRGVRQIDLKRISIIRDTNEEVRCWSELSSFRAEVLSIPWSVPEDVEKALLREARGEVKRKRRRDGRESHRTKSLRDGNKDALRLRNDNKESAKRKRAESGQNTRDNSVKGSSRHRAHGLHNRMIDPPSASASASASEYAEHIPHFSLSHQPPDYDYDDKEQDPPPSSQGRKISPPPLRRRDRYNQGRWTE